MEKLIGTSTSHFKSRPSIWGDSILILPKIFAKQRMAHKAELVALIRRPNACALERNLAKQCQARPCDPDKACDPCGLTNHRSGSLWHSATVPQRRLRICQVVQRWIPGRATGSTAQHGVVWVVHGELIEKKQEISKKGIRYTKYIILYYITTIYINYTLSCYIVLYYIELYCVTLYQTILSYIMVNCIILH